MKAAVIRGPRNISYDTVDDRLPLSEIAHGYDIFKKKNR